MPQILCVEGRVYHRSISSRKYLLRSILYYNGLPLLTKDEVDHLGQNPSHLLTQKVR